VVVEAVQDEDDAVVVQQIGIAPCELGGRRLVVVQFEGDVQGGLVVEDVGAGRRFGGADSSRAPSMVGADKAWVAGIDWAETKGALRESRAMVASAGRFMFMVARLLRTTVDHPLLP